MKKLAAIDMIESCSFGRIIINGKTYTSDVIIYPGRVDDSWWRKSGHLLQKDDLPEVIRYNPDVLIVGTGSDGLMDVLDETRKVIESKGIELIDEKTKKACETYNKLQEKRKVVAAFHLTC